MNKNVTIIDIAKALGISKSTVSRALANKSDVKKETRIAVLDMAKRMHYIPNPFAKNLTISRTKTIGVVVPEFVNSFFPRIIIQIQNFFQQNGYRVLITQCDESYETERKNLSLLESNLVEGILISETEKGKNVEIYDRLIREGIPIVFFNRADPNIHAPKVIIDDYKWAFFATEHLILTRMRLGENSPAIMHFKGPATVDLSENRFRGYCDALSKYRIAYNPSLVITCESFTRDAGQQMTNQIIETGNIPNALFCFNDQLAIGAMKALKHHGILIPQRISIFGFTESQSALVTEPALSSVEQPLEDIGKTAASLLLEKINDPQCEDRTIVLTAKLNVRGSSDPDKL